MIIHSTTPRTEASLGNEQLEATAAALQELIVLLYEKCQRTPGQFSYCTNQTSSGLFVYLPRRNSDLIVFTPWGEMSWGMIPRGGALQEVFDQIHAEAVLEPGDDSGFTGLRGHVYALESVGAHELPPSVLTCEEHVLESPLPQRSFEEYFPDYPACLPI